MDAPQLKPSPPPSAQGSSAAGNPQRPALTGDPSDANGAAPPRAAEGAREAACREDELSALLSAKLRIDEGDGVRDAPPVAGRPSGRFTVAQHRACRPPWPQHGHRGHGQTQAPPGPPPLDEPRAPFVSGDERLRRGDPPDAAAAPSVAVRPRPRAPLAWDPPGVPPGVVAALPGHPAAPAAAIPGRQTHRPAAFAGERGPPPRPPGTQEDGGAFPAAPGAPGGAWGQHAVPSAGAGRDDAEPHRVAEGGARPGPVPRHGRRATGPQSRLPKPRS
ncbi:unnamed protein product [Lampetra fluviatilis]